MPQSLSKIYLHVVFSTKNREPLIHDDDRERLYAYLGGVFKGMGCASIIIGGDVDHIHALFCLDRSKSVSEIVREPGSTRWYKETMRRKFQWQNGYGAFSVSKSVVPKVIAYIANQKEHHRHHSFQEAYVRLLDAYEVEYHSQYLWD